MNIRGYFDLREPVTFRGKAPVQATTRGSTGVQTAMHPGELTLAWQIATYFILLLSILASRFLDLYRAGVTETFELDWAYLLFLAIASLLAFPVVYDKTRLNRDQPILMQIGLIFTAGMGWEKIVATAIGK